MTHAEELRKKERFAFGANWARFLANLDTVRIAKAKQSLRDMLGTDDLTGKRFLDIGSGSGLFSLAARGLGAEVHSFDYDPESVACTAELKRRHFPDDPKWKVEEGSALNADYLKGLGTFDIVYSWGVLHHTGEMWRALGNVAPLVAKGGQLFIAIYNDQGCASRMWLAVKRLYNAMPAGFKWLVLWPAFARLWAPTFVRDLLTSGNPFRSWRAYGKERGMGAWRDVVDWVGGYPFEVAKPETILDFYRARGFELRRMTTCGGGLGCNEFVFEKTL